MGNAKSRHQQLKRTRSCRDNGSGPFRCGPGDPDAGSLSGHPDDCLNKPQIDTDFFTDTISDEKVYKQRVRSRSSQMEKMDQLYIESHDTDSNKRLGHDTKARIAAVAARTTSKLRKLSSNAKLNSAASSATATGGSSSARTSMSSASSGHSSTTSSFDAGPGRDKSLMSLTAASMPCDTSSTSASNIPEEEPEDLAKLTFAQLSLIQLTWQAVIIDSANLCLNFFMDINRMFPVKRKNSNSSNESGSTFKATGRSLMSRITSSQSSSSDSAKTSSELSYNALKFTCAVDSTVRSMTEDFKGNVNTRTQELLQDIGSELYMFFGIDKLTPSQKNKMTASFVEFLRLAALHSGSTRARARATFSDIYIEEWTDEMTEAWRTFFHTLLFHLENDDILD